MEHHLTNEKIRARFKNQFELVNYAILLAENMIKTGREARVRIDTENPAMVSVTEIEAGKDQLEALDMEEQNEREGRYSTAQEERRRENDLETIEA